MTPEQAKRVSEGLEHQAHSCDSLVAAGSYEGVPHSEDALQYFRDQAAAYRAAAAVLRAMAQAPVIALPPCDPDGLDALAAFDARQQWLDLHDFSRVRP